MIGSLVIGFELGRFVVTKLTCGALSIVAMLCLAAIALAKSNTLNGTLKGNAGAKISLSVTLNKHGEPAKVSNVSLKNATYSCNDNKTTGTVSKTFPGSARVIKDDSHGKTIWTFHMQFNPQTGLEFGGNANKTGTRITEGSVSYYFGPDPEPESELSCGLNAAFTANK